MAKFQVILFVTVTLFVSLLFVDAQRTRSVRLTRQRSRQYARQEVAADAPVTPYPSADELKPEVPFEGAAAVEPTPDEVYGPPEPTPNIAPDQVYGPPEVSGNDLAADDADAVAEPTPIDEQQARLIAARRSANSHRRQVAYRQANTARSAAARAAKLRTQTVRRSA